jgi:DNA-binding LytR/AlgR family response regulator
MIKAIAVDDEPVALDVIRNHAAKAPFLDLRVTFLSATEALLYMKTEEIQLVFLDIHMPDLSGLEFAGMVKHRTQVIFTTAYAEHALTGFELGVTDYLLKPIIYSRFLQACELAESRLSAPKDNVAKDNSLFVKDGYNWVRIDLDNLLYAESEDNYISLYETNKRTMTRMTMNDLLGRIPADKFVRVHKSYIVALSKVEKIEKHQVIVGGAKVPVSGSYRERFMEMALSS